MTNEKTLSAFNLPYNQSSTYWLAVFPDKSNISLMDDLTGFGLTPFQDKDNILCMPLSHPWDEKWRAIYEILTRHSVDETTQVALVPGDKEATVDGFTYARKPARAIELLADSLWLGEAMIEDRVVSYMQPVLDKRGKVFGYEAFARVETSKEPIGGGRIIAASKGLNAEYVLDRHLHVKAITSFIASDLEGFLFINFVPGFIHRPEKYLEGLSDAAHFNGMPAKKIVLDFTHSETKHDLVQLKNIFDYCRSKGYSLSLDDIASVSMAKKILETIRPDFIKLDSKLVRSAKIASEQRVINELVSIAQASGSTVLAEGVETQEIHQELLKAGVELFQGYLFSPPVPVSKVKKAVG